MFRLLIFFLCGIVAQVAVAQKQYLLVGTYSTDTSGGVYIYEWQAASGNAVFVGRKAAKNASFLAISKNRKNLYAVLENADSLGAGGSIIHYGFNQKNGELVFKSEMSSKGKHPCHIALNQSNSLLAAANYNSGNAILVPLDASGNLKQNNSVSLQHVGSSIDSNRQKAPHAHHVLFQNKTLFVTDLGIDKVKQYNLKDSAGFTIAAETQPLELKPGNGPRHSVLHPNKKIMFVLNELKGSLTVYRKEQEKWNAIQTISVQPNNYTGPSSGAAIILSKDGRFLYTSNRGTSNTISIAAVKDNFELELKGFQSSLGIKPRNINFSPDEEFLLAAHQESHDIIIFKRDKVSGMLTDTGNRIRVGKPVCLVFAK